MRKCVDVKRPPTVTRVSTVKRNKRRRRRHHRSKTTPTQQGSTGDQIAKRRIDTSKSGLSSGITTQQLFDVSTMNTFRSQNNSLHWLMTKSTNYDLNKSAATSHNMLSNRKMTLSGVRLDQMVMSANNLDSINSKIHTASINDTTLDFHSSVNNWYTTSKGPLFYRHSRKPYFVYRYKEEKDEKRRRRRRRGGYWACCPCCSPCCCLLTGILLSLLLVSLAALIGILITTKGKMTTSTTTTTTSSSTSTTTTSATTTTSTSSTSSSSSSTSTSTSSSSSTSSTSTTSTTTSSTSSTVTSSTSITTTSATTTSIKTTTVTTVTTTTTAATVSITSNTCTSGWKGVTILYHCDNCADILPYTQFTDTYTAISNQTRIAFSFREDVGCFALDAVSARSIAAPSIELIANNDFETGTMSSWTYCNPQGASSAGAIIKNSDNFVCMGSTYQAQSGSYFYYDGAVGNCDYLIQTFPTNIGSTYTISYWLYNQGSGTASSADVIISI